MFTVKKTIILVLTFLFLLSTMVVAAYTPTVSTDWGDFAEKTAPTFSIVSNTDYSFSVLSEKHTFKAVMSAPAESCTTKYTCDNGPCHTESICQPTSDQVITIFVDNQNVGSGTNSATATSSIKSISLSFAVTASSSGKSSVIIKTNGVTSASLVAAGLISKSEQGENQGVYFSTSTLTAGGVIHFSLDGTPFTVVYREHKTDGANEFTLAFQNLNFQDVATAPAPAKIYFSAKTDPLSQSITDNFWNKFTFNLKVTKYEVINQIPLVTVTMSEKQDVKAVVQNSFQGMTNQVWGSLDFSDSTVSQVYDYYNSQDGLTPFIYGPLKVGSSTYYVAQTQEKDSAGVSSVKVYVKGGRFDWKDADNYILGPEEMKKSTVLIPTGGKTMVGSAMSVLLPGSLSEIYFVPLDFDFDITTAYPKGETKFFVGGETAFKQQFPTVTANVYTSTTGSLSSGTGLPSLQVPTSTGTQPTAGSGECVGKANGEIVEHLPIEPAPAVSIKQYSLCVNGVPAVCDQSSVGLVRTVSVSSTWNVDLRCIYNQNQYQWGECDSQVLTSLIKQSGVGGAIKVAAGVYDKQYLCASDKSNPSLTHEAWFICPASVKKANSDGITDQPVADKYACLSYGWQSSDLTSDGKVTKADLDWIKNNPQKFWDTILKKVFTNLAIFMKAMFANWS